MSTIQHFSLETLISQVCPRPQIIPEDYVTTFQPLPSNAPVELHPLPVEFDALVPLDRIRTVRWDPSDHHTFFKSIILLLLESTRLLDRGQLDEMADTMWSELPKPSRSNVRITPTLDHLDKSPALQTWLADQFQINILIFVWGNDGIQSVEERNTIFEQDHKNPFLPTLLIFKPSPEIYQPIIVEMSDMVWADNSENLLRRIYVGVRSFLSSSVPEEVAQLLYRPIHAPVLITGSLEKKTLQELQQLALERGISITKASPATGKQIRKMKADLVTDLLGFV